MWSAPQIGIESSSYEYVVTEGITPSKDFMLGGGQTYTVSNPFKSSLSVSLNDRAQVKAVSSNGSRILAGVLRPTSPCAGAAS